MSTIIVYGATGLTGGLTAEALIARGQRPLLGGRDANKLRATAARLGLTEQSLVLADATRPPEIARMVERADVLVSCAGPFLAFGEPVVAACAARGVSYVDSTGEAPFVQMIARRYDATARARGCALVPACAFEVAVGDAAAERAAEGLGEGVDIEIAYGLSHAMTSRGTRASIAGMLGRAGMAFVDGQVREEPIALYVRSVAFHAPIGPRRAVSFPSPEVLTVPRHVPARTVRTFMNVRAVTATRLIARALTPAAPYLAPFTRALLERGGPEAPSPEQRRATRFQIVATARSADGARTRRVTVAGSDPYGLSGALLAEAAIVLASGRITARGMLAPSQVLGADTILRIVQSFEAGGVSIEEA